MSTQGRSDRGYKSARQIEGEADQSRARIEALLDQIQARFSPGQLMEQAQSYLKSGPGEFGSNLGGIIKNNPVPVALAGIGLSWLALAGSQHQSRPDHGANGFDTRRVADEGDLERQSYPDLEPRPARGVAVFPDVGDGRVEGGEDRGLDFAARSKATGESAQRLTQDVGQRLGDAGGQVRRQAGRVQDEASRGARQAKDSFLRLLTEQPLVVAGIGVALGALLGAALPSTAQEDEVMGEASDGLKREAQDFGREQMQTAQTAIAEKVDEAGASQPDGQQA